MDKKRAEEGRGEGEKENVGFKWTKDKDFFVLYIDKLWCIIGIVSNEYFFKTPSETGSTV